MPGFPGGEWGGKGGKRGERGGRGEVINHKGESTIGTYLPMAHPRLAHTLHIYCMYSMQGSVFYRTVQ